MLNSEDLGKDPKGTAKTQLRKICSKGSDAIRFRGKKERHHHKQSEEGYLKQLKAGKKPTISKCRQALNKIPLDSHQEAELRYYLGLAYLMSKEFIRAETTYLRALSLCEQLNWKEGMSPIYSDLGYIFTVRGKLNDAEEWLLKALEIDKQLGKSARMAIDYSRLAVVYRRRKELDKAEKMAHKSLRLAELHDLDEEMARQYNNLGVIYLHQFKLGKAERMLHKGLDIDTRLERSEGKACKYYNLGWVYKARQDINQAIQYGQVSKGLFKKLGMQHEVRKVERFLADLEE